MSLSEKDKKLLLVLAVLVIICVPYFFFIRPMLDNLNVLQKDVADLKKELNYQQSLALKEADYLEDAGELAYESSETVSRFPTSLDQEASILFMHYTEQILPISLYQVSFGDDVAAQLTSEAEEEAIHEVEKETGNTSDDQVIRDNTQSMYLGGGMEGVTTQTRIAYDAGYEEFKNFLQYIMDYPERMVITELDASYSAEMERVNGNFTLAQYALAGGGRNTVGTLEPNLMQGTTNVFKQATGNFDVEVQEDNEPDFFVMVNQPDADLDAVIVGRSRDVTESSYLTSDKNDRQEVTISFEGFNGQYIANYSIGDESYGGDGVSFDKPGNINLQLTSSVISDKKDKVEIDLNIINNTDRIVNVELLNDPDGRIEIKGKTGDIIVK